MELELEVVVQQGNQLDVQLGLECLTLLDSLCNLLIPKQLPRFIHQRKIFLTQ